MSPDAHTCALLESAGYPGTHGGLVSALGELAEARALLAEWLADGETIAVLQGARAHLDRAASHVVVGVTRDEAGHVQPVVVSADVPADRTETCGVPAERRNCWTCTWSNDRASTCWSVALGDDIDRWIRASHPGGPPFAACPPEAAGCPGWEARQ